MKKVFISGVFVLSVIALQAQNLDPTVEVSRVYEGKLVEVRKPVMDMSVPDTLYKFDLDFDYSVFENPYKGSYEFSPYMLDMHPESDLQRPSKLYLRAGAGYTLHPTFDLYWTPDLNSPFSVNVYGTHRSYIGKYRQTSLGNPEFKGFDLYSTAGVDFGYDWKKAALDFGASYEGIAVEDYMKKRSLNGLGAYVTLASKSSWQKQFSYNVLARYQYAEDKSVNKLKENNFSLDAVFGPSFSTGSKISIDLGVELDSYTGLLDMTAASFYLTPHYVYDKGRLQMDFGLRVSAAMLSSGFNGNQVVYPDIRMDVALIPDAMKMYLKIGGGEKLNSYMSYVRRNHHLDGAYAYAAPVSLIQPSVERVSAEFGFEGRVSNFFSYNIRGGYSNKGYAPLDGAVSDMEGTYRPYLGYASFQSGFAALDWDLNLQSVRFDGTAGFEYSWGISDPALFSPPAFVADAELVYSWRKRVTAGLECRYASARRNGNQLEVPWYVDLGVRAEYMMNRKMSLWLRGGNLLNMEIQRNLFFAEKGVDLTVGICLNF